jgi:hypothetical protein
MSTTGYNLQIPTETYYELKKYATEEGTTIADLLRKAIKLFIFFRSVSQNPDAHVLIQQNNETKELLLDMLIGTTQTSYKWE